MPHSHTLEVDGVPHGTDDAILDGRQVRELARLLPPSDFVLVRIHDGFASSVGLEEPVHLAAGRPARFRSFASDRIFSFTMDERGWEWGDASIAEADVRAIAGLADDHELVLDADRDEAVARGGTVLLSGAGVEHLRSRKAEPRRVAIVVNGRPREVEAGEIGFDRLVALAFPAAPTGPNVALTASYRKGPPMRPEGSLLPGQFVQVIEGMTFNVTATDKS